LISFIPKKKGGENKGKYVKETEKHGKTAEGAATF